MSEAVKKRGWSMRDSILALMLVVMLGGLVMVRALYTPYRIPSQSMTPTLLIGEYVAAPNVARTGAVARVSVGDVVFHTQTDSYEFQSGARTYVRRVLALPGQRIAFRDGVPIVDGVAAEQVATGERGPEGERILRETLGGRSYLVAYSENGHPELHNMPERIVPAGNAFLVGDSRDNAMDSRIAGAQPLASIKQAGGWIIFSPVSGRAGRRIE
jgi:signal peptidase I